MTDEIDIAEVDAIVEAVGSGPADTIPILRAVQDRFNYLPEAALRRIPEITKIRPADILGVSSFYSHFRHSPAGKHTVKVCVGTACHVKGSARIVDAVRRYLGIPQGEDTDSDRLFTVAPVSCLGCCTLAPAVQIDDVTYGHLTPSGVGRMLDDFLDLQKRSAEKGKNAGKNGDVYTGPSEVRIGLGSCCIAGGSLNVRHALEKAISDSGAATKIKRVGCVGMCHQTPLVEVVDEQGDSTLYAKVTPAETRRIIRKHFKPAGPVRRIKTSISSALEHVLTDQVWDPITRHSIDVRDAPVCAFLGRQKHIAAESCGIIDPVDLEEYRRHGGYISLQKVLDEKNPDRVVDVVTRSGLRGRGGAGFPVGKKWSIVRAVPGEHKYVVMNGDEGDPGAFMDRMLLESYPYRVLEGIVIAAFAIGASEAVLYIRAEYPLALLRIREAIARAESGGFLGERIMGSDFSLDVRIMEGAGAFVCGEETGLLASIEGRRGMPSYRPPFPAEKGLNGLPTLINNVETFSCLPWIFRHGPDEFAALGTDDSKGTKVFSLAGKVARGGLIEVPMGITIREIVEEIGGGVAGDRKFKAVQIGGPSGGCIPVGQSDTPIDYEALGQVGAIMGSGGLVVLDDSDCMVDIARYFMSFTQIESCGKCTHCRLGTKRMLEILDRLCEGKGTKHDIDNLEQLALTTRKGSLCGLGRTAPNPILTTLRYYRDEYEAHVEGRCPAGKCKALISYVVNDKCIGCTRCAQACPADAIEIRPYEQHEIDDEKCVRCDTCRPLCPAEAIEIISG